MLKGIILIKIGKLVFPLEKNKVDQFEKEEPRN